MSKSLTFYSDKDLEQINDNLDQIEVESIKTGYKLLDPSNEEYDKVMSIIVNFIKEQKRIVYGGSAYHAIIQHYRKDKDSTNTIYPEWDRYDIEFYSPNPLRDLVMISNRIHDAGIKFVIGRQAQHDETFTIFANFLQYCDMSYMPEHIYNKMEYIEINGMRYIHPEMILIDIFRMFNDPITSYWRLGKVFKRMKLLLDKFPYDFITAQPIPLKEPAFAGKEPDHTKIINYVITKLVNSKHQFLFTGQLAYLIYTQPARKEIDTDNSLSQIEIISDDHNKVGKFIKTLTYKWAAENKQLNNYDNLFNIKFFSRFFQYWDNRTVIYYKDQPIFTILGSSNRCLPFINCQINFGLSNKLDIKVGTFLVTFNYYFIAYWYEKINNLGFYFKDRNFINSLLTIRNEYLKSNNKTIMDKTIYKEFVISCIGKTMEFSREFLLRMADKRAKGQKGLLSYDPNTARGSQLELTFEQADGLEIKETNN